MCVPIQTKKALPDLLNKPCNFKGVKLQKKALTLKKSSRIRVIFQFSRILDSSDLQLSLLYKSDFYSTRFVLAPFFVQWFGEAIPYCQAIIFCRQIATQHLANTRLPHNRLHHYWGLRYPPSVVLIRFRSIWKAVENAATTRKGDARCVLSQSPCSPSPS